ncbi:MAG: CoA transferase, partial [Candidatus Binatia bacterium]
MERLRVLEATTAQAGPIVGTVLADFGAEVIKIEQPCTGNQGRQTQPVFQGEFPLENSTYFLSINRNKKNITLDLRHPQGQEVFLELVRRMDVVVENFKPGTMDHWGLGYEDVRRIKPDMIYTSISG